ncbi:MAG TPA: hypothetical protein VEI01_05545 [Terriglobales bacterium]|nr:hypothetical protein [Terriglobales bacterium]
MKYIHGQNGSLRRVRTVRDGIVARARADSHLRDLPDKVPILGHSSYGLSGILAGMIAPPLLATLIGQDVAHHWHYLPFTYAVYGAAAMLALLFIRETRNIRLEDLDHGGT